MDVCVNLYIFLKLTFFTSYYVYIPQGTFLIGVSQSEACLVINVVTSPGKVLPVKVKFNADSPNPFSFDMKHGMTTSFISLEDLIKSNAQLLYFYPSFPLENGNTFIHKDALLP